MVWEAKWHLGCPLGWNRDCVFALADSGLRESAGISMVLSHPCFKDIMEEPEGSCLQKLVWE